MSALVNTTVPLDITVYDRMAAGLVEPWTVAAGFHSRAAYAVPGGFVVGEIWNSADDRRAFFESAVKPNLRACRCRGQCAQYLQRLSPA